MVGSYVPWWFVCAYLCVCLWCALPPMDYAWGTHTHQTHTDICFHSLYSCKVFRIVRCSFRFLFRCRFACWVFFFLLLKYLHWEQRTATRPDRTKDRADNNNNMNNMAKCPFRICIIHIYSRIYSNIRYLLLRAQWIYVALIYVYILVHLLCIRSIYNFGGFFLRNLTFYGGPLHGIYIYIDHSTWMYNLLLKKFAKYAKNIRLSNSIRTE